MNNDNIKRLNIEIENFLYPLTSLLKQTNETAEVIIEIARFKEKHKDLMFGLERNYVENYLNKMYSKRNNGEKLIELKEEIEKEGR